MDGTTTMNKNMEATQSNNAFLVVGYRNSSSSTYKELKLYGLYTSTESAMQRITNLTGNYNEKFTEGRGYVVWINAVRFGDFERLPNAGAFVSE